MFIIVLLLVQSSLWAKLWCSPTELNLKNCSLSHRELELNFNKSDVRVNNGVWHHLRHLKSLEKNQQWHSLGIRAFNQRVFLQAKVWVSSEVIDSIEHLKWLVWEVSGTELNLKINEVIQKRKKIEEDKYITDPLEKHGIKPTKANKLKWWYKSEQKTF